MNHRTLSTLLLLALAAACTWAAGEPLASPAETTPAHLAPAVVAPQEAIAIAVDPLTDIAKSVNQLRAVNLGAAPVSDVRTVVLPWARGTYHGGPLHVGGVTLQTEVIGARWPDGSVRYLRAHVPVSLAAGAVDLLTVRAAPGRATTAFVMTQPVRDAVAAFRAELEVGGGTASFGAWEAVEGGHLAIAYRSRLRVPGSPVWAELTLEAYSGLDHVRWWLHYGDSDPRDPLVKHQLGEVWFSISGGVPAFRDSRKVLRSSGSRHQLDAGGVWGDGQSQLVRGVLLCSPKAAPLQQVDPELLATTWPVVGAYGPWGYVPDPPQVVTPALAGALATASWNAHRDTGPWAGPGPHGCLPSPGSTGDQPDFAAAVMLLEAHGWPHRLASVRRSVDQEACRPTWLRDVAGAPLALGSVPGLLLWDSRPHFQSSQEKLGKTAGLASWDCRKAPSGEWWGHDREHYSPLHQIALYLLTGDRFARACVDHQVEVWLGMMQVSSGNPSLDGTGAARDIGRTLHAGAWLYLATGRQDLANRLRARVQRVKRDWAGAGATGPVRPTVVRAPDARHLNVQHWRSWEEPFAAMGLDAEGQVLGDADALDLARQVSATVVDDAFRMLNGQWIIDDSVEWKAGGAADPTRLRAPPVPPTTFVLWGVPGVLIGRREGDPLRCDAILKQALGTSPDWRAREWAAVR